MIDVLAHEILDHRAGRMLAGLIESENANGKVVLTTEVSGVRTYHQAFELRRWNSRENTKMITVEAVGTADWANGKGQIKVVHLDLFACKFLPARDPRNADALLQYAARCAVNYAWLGDAALPTPKNGTLRVLESLLCGMCGMKLRDPVSIDRGIGPDCFKKATGSRTIMGRQATALLT